MRLSRLSLPASPLPSAHTLCDGVGVGSTQRSHIIGINYANRGHLPAPASFAYLVLVAKLEIISQVLFCSSSAERARKDKAGSRQRATRRTLLDKREAQGPWQSTQGTLQDTHPRCGQQRAVAFVPFLGDPGATRLTVHGGRMQDYLNLRLGPVRPCPWSALQNDPAGQARLAQ